MNKTHRYYLDNALNNEGNGEYMSSLFNENIGGTCVFSVVIFISSHENRIDENHKNDEIVKHRLANEPDSFVTN